MLWLTLALADTGAVELRVASTVLQTDRNTLGSLVLEAEGGEPPYTWGIQTTPVLGESQIDGEGILYYWPRQGVTGEDAIGLVVQDAVGGRAEGTLRVDVEGGSCSTVTGGGALWVLPLLLVRRRVVR